MTLTSAERSALAGQVVAMRRQGVPFKEISARLGIKRTNASALYNDPDGSKARARKQSYRGVCVECGGPTDGGNGPKNTPMRCKWCVRGVAVQDRVTPSQPSVRRTLPVRLSEIREDIRLQAAYEANRIEQGDFERHEILLAALMPSDTVYWLSESARTLLAQVAA